MEGFGVFFWCLRGVTVGPSRTDFGIFAVLHGASTPNYKLINLIKRIQQTNTEMHKKHWNNKSVLCYTCCNTVCSLVSTYFIAKHSGIYTCSVYEWHVDQMSLKKMGKIKSVQETEILNSSIRQCDISLIKASNSLFGSCFERANQLIQLSYIDTGPNATRRGTHQWQPWSGACRSQNSTTVSSKFIKHHLRSHGFYNGSFRLLYGIFAEANQEPKFLNSLR